nr:O-antigen polymerase [Pseudoalteromonas rubra]
MLSPSYLVILTLFAFSYVGILPLYFEWDQYYFDIGVRDKSTITQMLLCSSIVILSFILGSLTLAHRFPKPILMKSRIEDINEFSLMDKLLIAVVMIFILAVLMLYVSKVDNLAILLIFANDSEAAKLARSAMGNNFSGGYHWYSLVMHEFMYIVTLSLFVNCLKSKSLSNLVFFGVAFLINSFSLLMSTEKAPFMWLIISMVVTHLFVRKSGYVQIRMFAKFTAFALILATILMSLFMGVEDLLLSFYSIFSRLFSGSIAPSYFYLGYIPEHQDFLFGRSFPNPAGILPFEHFRLTVEVMNWRFPELAGLGIVGSSPTAFWAEAYSNFSYIGIIFFGFIMGVYTSIAFSLTSKLPNSAVSIAFSVWLIMHFKDLSQSGFSGYFFDMKLAFVLMFCVFINKVIKRT